MRVHHHEYLPFGLQPDNVAMTPNGEIYFNSERFKEDFSIAPFQDRIWFMHEMVHVWQHQLGYPVFWRGAIRIGLSYKYTLEVGKTLSAYNMEAQGNVLADYWAIKTRNPPPFINEQKHWFNKHLFELVLKDFIKYQKKCKSGLPGGKPCMKDSP